MATSRGISMVARYTTGIPTSLASLILQQVNGYSSTRILVKQLRRFLPDYMSAAPNKGVKALASSKKNVIIIIWNSYLYSKVRFCTKLSAGKSFVAEILMLRRVISTGKIAILVLPYVSICAEKAEHLEVLLEPLGKHVRSFYGNQGGGTLPKDTSVAVCTIEKANFLVNKLLEEGRLSEVGIIVIDELHMVGDQNRGYLLELMLTKLRYASGEGNIESSSEESSGSSSGKTDPANGLQIVGMSATMPNVVAVADWLQGTVHITCNCSTQIQVHIGPPWSILSTFVTAGPNQPPPQWVVFSPQDCNPEKASTH